jgi:microcystin-dependent protein
MSVVILSSGPPPGSIMLHAGAATNPAPDGWLWCDGAEYHTADYPNLAAACNDMYGTASAGMFRVPNMSGRVAIGSGNDGTTTRNPGETPGAATHTLSTTEMPSHRHDIIENSGNSSLLGGHFGVPGSTSSQSAMNGSSAGPAYIKPTGGGGAHNNIQPSAVVGGYIIKT